MARETTEEKRFAPLPLDEGWGEISEALSAHHNLVLVAEPGAGKTTRFPPRLLRSGLVPDPLKILVLEPRRLAARAAAHRIADEQGWKLGQEVGYQVRFENRTTARTRLTVLTEGLLARRLQIDPELREIGAVILDEFHERSQHTDLAVSLLFELQALARPDLRIIVMSATLDAERVARFLNDCPIVRVPGRTHPVDIHHSKHPLLLETGPSFLDQVASSVLEAVEGQRAREGDVLVFLPGAREIRAIRERVASRASAKGFECFELHGSLPLEEQDRAIRKLPDRNKIVLATNIAETSLTIDGVGTVIDTGLARVMRTDAIGFPRLQLSRISAASATQRAGRAGRQGPGHCHRLWSKLDDASMPPFELPEILRTDLSEAILTLASQGVTDPEAFTWFEKPPSDAIHGALALLSELGFRKPDGGLTSEGHEALKLPLPVRLSRLMLEAVACNQVTLGARIAALLSEKDIALSSRDLKRHANMESDLLLRLHLLENRHRGTELDHNAVRNVMRVSEALESAATRVNARELNREAGAWGTGLNQDEIASRLLLLAFPDRLCRRRRPKEPSARMIGGRGVTLAPFSTVETAEFFLALDSSEPPPTAQNRADAFVTIASRVERSWIEAHFSRSLQRTSQVIFDEETRSIQKQTATSLRDLPLEDPHISRPGSDEAFSALIAACKTRWSVLFASQEELERIFARLAFVAREFPDANTSPSNETFLEEACFGATRLSEVLNKPLSEIYLRHLPQETARLLHEAAPETLLVPSGSRIRVHYPAGRAPYIEVRIQEIFGLRESPRIAKGRVPITFHLLGPNFRPVQVTADLGSFWRNGYAEVRKELRARYPKHSWPEDPMTAPPEAKGRRRT